MHSMSIHKIGPNQQKEENFKNFQVLENITDRKKQKN